MSKLRRASTSPAGRPFLAAVLGSLALLAACAPLRAAVMENGAALLARFADPASGEKELLALSLARLLGPEESADLILSPPGGRILGYGETHIIASRLLGAIGPGCRLKEKRPPLGSPDPPGLPPSLAEKASRVASLLSGTPDWRLRLIGARMLSCLEYPDVTREHRLLLSDEVWPVRHRAIRALAALPAGGNVTLLREILDDKGEGNLSNRLEAVRAMGELQHLPGLLSGLSDPHHEVVLNSAWSLGRMSPLPAEARRALEEAFRRNRSNRVREEIQAILDLPGGPSTGRSR